MSLILEALRRSEAERRRGSPPSLLGGGDAPRARATSPWPMALAGLLIGVALAGAAAWWFSRRADAPPAPMPATDEAALSRPADATMEAPHPPTGTFPDVAIEPVPAAAYGPATAAAAARTVPATPAAPALDRARESPRSIAMAPPASPGAMVKPTAPLTPIAPPPASNGAAAAAESGLGPRDGDLPWSALATGAGDALPAPRISMHVYADEPARRFAIVDGQRRREGDLLQPGMPLLEIRRDGLRVGWQG
ncbi:MAG: general secretion pathway protein GspB, partial [Silanimonas sp.]